VASLEDFIDEHTDPRAHYVDLQEIAEGDSGSVYAARVIDAHKLTFPQPLLTKNGGDGKAEFVAIKNVPILPSGSPKLVDLERELKLMKGVRHEFVLGMDALYVDLVEDSLWIRMELMERSLADVVGLAGQGLMVQERMIARFASDVSVLSSASVLCGMSADCHSVRFFWHLNTCRRNGLHTVTYVQTIYCSTEMVYSRLVRIPPFYGANSSN
jgi:hypothetical protein